jgi:hypothetical protein
MTKERAAERGTTVAKGRGGCSGRGDGFSIDNPPYPSTAIKRITASLDDKGEGYGLGERLLKRNISIEGTAVFAARR